MRHKLPGDGARLRRKLFALAIAALPLGGVLFAACVSDSLGNKGASCERASECAGGLFCADKVCTDDITKIDGGAAANFMDTGTMASADASGEAMGDAPDTGPPVDTGTPIDTGTPVDTGSMPIDTGTAPIDTGTAPIDTGTAPIDTGTAPVDTGTAPVDTGSADSSSGD